MKRLALLTSLVVLLTTLVIVSACGQAAPKDIQAFYTKCAQAMEKRDAAALSKTMAPNMVSVDKKGKVQKAPEVIKEMTQAFSMMTTVKVKFVIVSATIKGNHATVVNDATMVGDIKNPQNGQTIKMKSVQHCKDTLVKGAGGWLMEKTVTLKDTTTINGQPMPGG